MNQISENTLNELLHSLALSSKRETGTTGVFSILNGSQRIGRYTLTYGGFEARVLGGNSINTLAEFTHALVMNIMSPPRHPVASDEFRGHMIRRYTNAVEYFTQRRDTKRTKESLANLRHFERERPIQSTSSQPGQG